MKELFYVVNLPHGLHARPAAQLAQICSAAQSMVTIIKGDKSANGKGVLGILGLDIQQGEIGRASCRERV